MKTLQELELRDIMPSSLTQDQNTLDIARSIDSELGPVTGAVREELILFRLDELDERIIDMLAWQYHVDFYELADTIEKKRNLVRDTIRWHMKKGTKYAILKSLENLGIEGEYINWYEYGGQPYTFRIKAHVKAEYYKRIHDYEALINDIRRAVVDSKAARSWLEKLYTEIVVRDDWKLYHGIAGLKSGYHRIETARGIGPRRVKQVIGTASLLSGEMAIRTSGPCERVVMKSCIAGVVQEIGAFEIRIRAQDWTEADKASVRN